MLDRTNVLFDWSEQADPARAALIMVDLQNDFVHVDGWVAQQQVPGFMGDTGIDAVLDRSKALLDAARQAEVLTVFVRMLGDDKYLSPALYAQYRRNHGHERPPCVQEGTWGADFYGELRPDGRPKEFVLDKHRYSAFIGTRLDQLLRSNGVQTLVVCGVATTGCVESTIRDGFMHDYYVVIASDACGDYEAARHANALSKLDLSFGTVVSVADVAQRWAPEIASVTRVGVIAPHAVAIRDLASFAVGLADLGYSDFWAGESDRADGIAPLAIAAAAEPRLSFGTAIVPVFTRGRALLAQTAATLASAAPGRVTIGLGASSPAIVEGWNSIPFVDPLGRVRDSVRYLRRALSGEKVDGGFRLGLVPDPMPALAIGALQPHMLRLAGREGDGVVLTSLGADDVVPLLERVAPARSDFAVIAWVTVCVVTDRADGERALAVARRRVGRYLLTPTYDRYHRWLGRGDLLDRMGNNPDDAPEQLIRDLVVIGSPDECRAQLERFVEAGVTTLLYEILPGVGDLAASLRVLPTNFRPDGRSIPT